MGAANQGTVAMLKADHDKADMAVVEHTHPRKDEEHAEWEHPVKGDENAVQVRTGGEREMALMAKLGVGETCDSPKTGKVWSTRWCYQRKGDAVRSRLVFQCTRGYTRTSCSEDLADTLRNLLALCRDGGLQCGVHAHASDRRSVCGASSGRKLAQGNGVATATSTQRFALRGGNLPSISEEPTRRCRVQAGHGGSVHLQQRIRWCEDVNTRR